jgi:hypothetical protein
MLRNESFKNNYNLTRKDSVGIALVAIQIMNSFMCKKTQKKILIKNERKENIAICA